MKRIISRLTAAILAFGMVFSCLPVSAADVVEKTQITKGWMLLRNNEADVSASIINTNVKNGENSLAFSNKSPLGNNVYARIYQEVKVKKGVTYKYGVSVKAQKAKGVSIMIGTLNKTSLLPFNGTFDWTDYEFQYTYEGADATVMFNVVIDNVTEMLCLDDFYLYECKDGEITGENLLANPGFEEEKIQISNSDNINSKREIITAAEFLSTSKTIPIYRTDNSASDWSGFPEIDIKDNYNFLKNMVPEIDNTAKISYCYDDNNFYFKVIVSDNAHYCISGNTYWQGDSIQIAFAEEIGVFKSEIGISYDAENNKVSVTNENVEANIQRNGNDTVYICTVPWTVFTNAKPDMFQFNAIINDNDNDGIGRKYCTQIAPGIATGKFADEYPVLYTMDNITTDYFAAITGNDGAQIRTENEYLLSVQNLSRETAVYDIELPNGESENVTVEASGAFRIRFNYTPDYVGAGRLEANITKNGETGKVGMDVNFIPDHKMYLEMKAECSDLLKEFKNLLDQCEEKDIPTDYETIDYCTIERFIGYMTEDADKYGAYDRILYSYNELKRLYQNSTEALKKYLRGEKKAVSVPRYVNSKISTDGISMIAEMEENGTSIRRPMFMTGYVDFVQAKEDIPIFDKFGVNYVKRSVKLYDIVTKWIEVPKWNLYERAPSGCEYTISVSDAVKKEGDYSLKLTRSTAWGSGRTVVLRQAVKVRPNTTYEFGLSAKGTSVDGVHFSCHPLIDSNFGLSQRIRNYINGTYDWTDHKFEYTTAEDEYILEFFIPMEAKVTELYIDNVFIREKGSDVNLIQNGDFELGKDTDVQKYDMYEAHIDEACRILEDAQRNNIAVTFIIGPHYFPEYAINEDPTVKDADGAYPSYMRFNPTHPTVFEIVDKLIEAVIPKIKDYTSLNDVCFANEPNIQVYNTSYYKPHWQDYLRKIYNSDINKLNQSCGTQYNDFTEISMDSIDEMTVMYNHLMNFNEDVLTEYLGHLSDKILEIAPELKIHAKILPIPHAYGRSSLKFGANYEKLAKYYTINGNDANTTHKNIKQPLLSKLEWYDMQTSIKDEPVLNTEDHIMADESEIDYSPRVRAQAVADIWQGGIHGRGGSAVWLWDRGEAYITNEFLNTNMMVRPDLVSALGREFLDLNRLSYEITALQKEKRSVAILYSHESWTYTPSFSNNMFLAYSNTLFNGLKPLILTESQMEKLNDYDMLIIPEATHVFDSTVESIKRFAQRGGKIVQISDNCLTRNEFNELRNSEAVEYIKSKSRIIKTNPESKSDWSSAENLPEILREEFKSMNFLDIRVIDSKTGKDIDDVEWLSAIYDGSRVLNLCNYDWDNEKEAEVYINGKKVEIFNDLKANEIIEDKLRLKPYTPVFVKFK